MSKTKQIILEQIARHSGVISPGLLALDLHLEVNTVKRHIGSLVTEGRIQYGWDGLSLELTDEERRDRDADRFFREAMKRN